MNLSHQTVCFQKTQREQNTFGLVVVSEDLRPRAWASSRLTKPSEYVLRADVGKPIGPSFFELFPDDVRTMGCPSSESHSLL